MTTIKQINGYEFNIMSIEEADYIDEYDVHLFKDSKTILFELNSEREGASSRFSISLTEDQIENFDPRKITSSVVELLEKEYTIAYSRHRLYEEIEDIQSDIKRMTKLREDFILSHDGEWIIDSYRYSNNSKSSEITLKINEEMILVNLDTGEIKYSDYVLRNIEVKVRNKDLLLIAIRSKMTNILNELGEKSV